MGSEPAELESPGIFEAKRSKTGSWSFRSDHNDGLFFPLSR